MKLGTVTGTIALCLMAVSVAWGGRLYAEHLQDFAAVKARFLYEECVRECKATCVANGVPEADCNCQRCLRYLEGDGE